MDMVTIDRTYKTLFLIACCLLCLCSCNKEDAQDDANTDLFNVSIAHYSSPGNKSYIVPGENHEFACWNDGDKININGVKKTLSIIQNEETGLFDKATVPANDIYPYDGQFLAAFPAELASFSAGAFSIELPNTVAYQTITASIGSGKQKVFAPMVAQSSEKTLLFENICSLVKFSFRNASDDLVEFKELTISCGKGLSGHLTVKNIDGQWSVNCNGLTDTARSLTAAAHTAPLDNDFKPFYLTIPPVGDIEHFSVSITLLVNGVGHKFTKTKNGDININANNIIDFGMLTYQANTLSDANGNTYSEKIPTGSSDDPYTISNEAEWFYWMRSFGTTSDKHFSLSQDISISNALDDFSATLDGNSHTITLNNSTLFSSINSGTVKNLVTAGTITNICYKDKYTYDIGAIAADATLATIENCTNLAAIKITDGSKPYRIGGLVGCTDQCSFTNCANCGTIEYTTKDVSYIGGLVGSTASFDNQFLNCYSTGAITSNSSTADLIGGLVGHLAGFQPTIYNSYCTAEITANANALIGGLVAQNSSTSTIGNCYYFGIIRCSPNQAGALCHTNCSDITHCYHTASHNAVHSTQNSGHLINCEKLSDATTVYGQATNSLLDKLNNNILALGIANARYWIIDNGIVTFR